jgi:adenosylcobinamide-phosphate synthase
MILAEPASVLGALLLALLVDGLAGDPPWLYRRLPHPVVLIGRAVGRLEALWLDENAAPATLRRRGALASLAVTAGAAAIGWAFQIFFLRLPLGWVWLGLLMSTLLAARGLMEHVRAVADGLDRSLEDGRRAVAHIVGRDPESLDQHAVARAAIESTTENFSDGFTAPLFWGALFGLPGMLAYKAINTLDSMIGHRSPRFRHFGRFAARLDDLVNWPAARLSALLILAAAFLFPGADAHAGWRAVRRDARRHRSPNAGCPEAAMAGALGLRLAGPRRYGGQLVEDAWMGAGRAAATPADIRRALRVLAIACALTGALLVIALVIAGL